MAKQRAANSKEEKSSSKDKPTKTIATRVVKPKVPVAEMVNAAMTNNRDGCTLQNIRGYIIKEFGAKMSKTLQNSIKDFLHDEFEQGRIKMAESDGENLKFNQKLQLVPLVKTVKT